MKILNIILGLSLTLACLPSWGGETPYARTCRLAGGMAWTTTMKSEQDTVLCRFDSAAIGAADFSELKWNNKKSESIVAYMSQDTSSDPSQVCAQFNANSSEAVDSEGTKWSLCVFGDGSMIEANTLAGSANSTANQALNQALQ